MFKAVLEDINLLKDSLDAVSALINEGTFKINKNGLSLIAMDPANVAMIMYNLLASAFTEYESTSDNQLTINIPYFVSILKRAGVNDSVEFKLIDGSNALSIKMTGDSTRMFTIPILETRGNTVNPPEKLGEGFKADVEVEAGVMREGVKDAMMISDCVSLICDPKSFMMITSSDTNEASLKLASESPSLIRVNANESVKSKYSLEYLDKMMKASKVTKSVKIKFANNYPMQMDYSALDKLKMSFILAPRIDTE